MFELLEEGEYVSLCSDSEGREEVKFRGLPFSAEAEGDLFLGFCWGL